MIGDYHGGGGALLLNTELRRESENKINLESRLAREDIAWSWPTRRRRALPVHALMAGARDFGDEGAYETSSCLLAWALLTADSPEPIPHWTSYPARLRVAGWPDLAIIAASTILLLVVLEGVKRIELVSALGRRRPARA